MKALLSHMAKYDAITLRKGAEVMAVAVFQFSFVRAKWQQDHFFLCRVEAKGNIHLKNSSIPIFLLSSSIICFAASYLVLEISSEIITWLLLL